MSMVTETKDATSDLIGSAATELLGRVWQIGELRKGSGLDAARTAWPAAAAAGWFSLLDTASAEKIEFADVLPTFRAAGTALLAGPLFSAAVAGPSLFPDAAPDLRFDDGSVAFSGGGWVGGPRPRLRMPTKSTVSGQVVLPEGDPAARYLVLPVGLSYGAALAIVATGQPGVVIRRLPTPDAVWSPCVVSLDGAEAAALIAGDNEAVGWLPTWHGCAWALRSAGVLNALVDLAVDYAKTREQFGGPIGRFQAVAHILADMAVQAATVDNVCSWLEQLLRTNDQRLGHTLQTAHGHITTCLRDCAEKALQVFGGIGFTNECDLHLYMKHALQLSSIYGTADQAAREVGLRSLAPKHLAHSHDAC
ncbi:MAG: hypothetical protein GEV28_06600 [Actinophytocola sp.]|uniref:acyl-CoA dehydrogenase family protein n=1 Tax=Actinophytocola sp. TaxID=1872138 RepID=UPI001326F7BF|nr:acyl-CoA dehydrogenase family protein [Actinophytocola sp.]MPZ80066.1 hypothetical protein [Actinophytocola sp.]